MARNPDYGFNHNNNHRWIALDDQYEIFRAAAGPIAKAMLDKARDMFLATGPETRPASNLIYGVCLNGYTAPVLRFVGEALKDCSSYDSTDDGAWALAISERITYLATDAYRYDVASEQLAMYGEIQNSI